MLKHIGLAIIALLLSAGNPALAANVAAPANPSSEIATLKAQVAALKDQRDLEKRLATLEGKTVAEDRSRDNLVKEMTFLGYVVSLMGFLITLFALGTGVASYFAAGSRAEKKAEEELTKIRGEFDNNVKATLVEIDGRMAHLNTTAADVLKRADETATNLQMTNEHLAEMARLRATMATMFTEVDEKMPLIREGARISEELGRSTGAGGDRKEATDAQKKTIVAAVAESIDQPEAQWSIDQFKTAIGKAMYVDKNWVEALRLTAAMEKVHYADLDARLYALNRRGDAEQELGHHANALTAYEAVIAITTYDPPPRRREDYIWAAHCVAYSLNELARFTEAESILRDFLPFRERIEGDETPGTLATRHNLIFGIFNQGRAAEAETMLRDLLSIRERIDGAEASDTLATRHLLARAILDQGRAAEAEAILRNLLLIMDRVRGAEASDTLATRHMLARAALEQSRAAEAEAMLRNLLPIMDRVRGAEASDTLVTRQLLGRAILDQDRAAEAVILFRQLLPIYERIKDAKHSWTLLVRTDWAQATLASDDPAAAAAVLRPIPDPIMNEDWLPRYAARLAFVRGMVADALGKRVEADRWLTEARDIYAGCYPADHPARKKVADFIAARG